MKRIFLVLCALSAALLLTALGLGFAIDDPAARNAAVQGMVRNHLFTAVGGLVFALMLHAIVLTYFMGTGRWMEETCTAYGLGDEARTKNQTLKYRMLPGMVLSLLLLVSTGALGAAADPASPMSFDGTLGMSAATVHFLAAAIAIAVHFIAAVYEYFAIEQNGEIVEEVMRQVRRMREERGLPV